ncbi:MAG: anhydro-N-acetylmuramic acid kinase [bacterium]|nr:anhydro-N-acetylmuramic acid kinase [bacterium]
MLIAGLMTGTSLDGIDVAVCDVDAEGVTLQSFATHPYTEHTLDLVSRALRGEASTVELCDLPFALSADYAAAIPKDVALDAIGIHGQTIWHNPPHSTWQAASGSALATLTGVPVVSDFRAADVAVGGQGAPLVPIFDWLTLHSTEIDRVALNIGGMANITLLPRNAQLETLRAFDTGPGNILIDSAVMQTFGKRYDEGGSIASAGRPLVAMLEHVKGLPFFALEPPKSTGRELFNDAFVTELHRRFLHPSGPSEDFVTTLTELVAWSIADHIHRMQANTEELVCSGGGVHNEYLMQRIAFHLPDVRVVTSDTFGIPADAKEAMCFAYLAWLTLHGIPGNVPTVTGASRRVVLGSISDPRISSVNAPKVSSVSASTLRPRA